MQGWGWSFIQAHSKPTTFCATIVLVEKTSEEGQARADRADRMLERITAAAYAAARTKTREIEGFPDFSPLVDELKRLSGNEATAKTQEFKVTSLQPSGALVIKEGFYTQFHEVAEFEALVSSHNATYNAENLRLTDPCPSPRKDETAQATIIQTPDEPLTPEKFAALPDPSLPQRLRI